MNVVLLGSGRGSNAEAILEAQARGELGQARVCGIIADKQDARILSLGERFNVPAFYEDPGPYRTKLTPEVEARYVDRIRSLDTNLVVLAGFMRVLKSTFLKAFADRIINLHPSLLPSFPGLDSIRQAWEYGVKVTGCTVHFVNEEIDGGHIIDQAVVRIEKSDTLESLEEKVHAAEHRLLPDVITRLSEGRECMS